MREVTTKVYTFEELSEQAKDKAREWFREATNADFSFESELITEDFEQQLEEYGFTNAKVNWSLSNCQGDGVSFIGKWSGKELLPILKAAYGGNIPIKVTRVIPWLTITFRRKHFRYVHELTVDTIAEIENYYVSDRLQNLLNDIENTVDDYRIDICSILEKQGYSQIDYMYSNEYIDELIIANEYEFTQEGKRWH